MCKKHFNTEIENSRKFLSFDRIVAIAVTLKIPNFLIILESILKKHLLLKSLVKNIEWIYLHIPNQSRHEDVKMLESES